MHTIKYERERPCTSDLLYNKNNLIGRLYRYLYIYILKLLPCRLLKHWFCWRCPSWLWSRRIPSAPCTGISCQGLPKITECLLMCLYLHKNDRDMYSKIAFLIGTMCRISESAISCRPKIHMLEKFR